MKVSSLLLTFTVVFALTFGNLGITQSSDIENEAMGTPAGWTNDINISGNSTIDEYPNMAISEDNIHTVWRNTWFGDVSIIYRNSNDAGNTWNEKQQIIPVSPMLPSFPDIGVNNSNVHVVYHMWETGSWEINYINSTDGGETWNPSKLISVDDSANSEGTRIAVNNSNLHVVWTDSRLAQTEVYYKRSIDGGITWDDALGGNNDRRITHDLSGAGPYDIAINCSNLHVLFGDNRDGSNDIYYIRSTDNGVTWDDGTGTVDEERKLTSNTTDRVGASIAVNGSTIHVVWVDMVFPGPVFSIYYRNSIDNGATWGSIQQLVSPFAGTAYAPQLAVQNDTVHMIWHDMRDGGQPEIYYKNSTDNGATWNPDLRLTELDGFISGGPKIALSGSQKHIIWEDQRDGNKEIYYKRFPEILPDTEPPDINHIPVAFANISQPINITANITDDIGVDAVYLNYTGVNGTNHNVSMNKWNGNWSFDIPGQNNIGFVDYFIWANDTSGNANMTLIFQIQIYDISKPEIYPIPVVSKNIGESINITANITDDVGVNEVFLNYTDVHGVNQNITMNKWGGNYSFDKPGQSNSGFVSYFIWANDTSGNDNMTQIQQIQIFDVTDPEINHVPITSANVSETINITANVTDDVSVSSVYLNYTGVNGTSYNVSMQKWNGNYSYEIPGQHTIGNVQYFIWANDSDGNDNRTIEHSIQINDVVKPEINHVPVVSVNVGEAVNITVNVTDDVGVDYVYLNYTDVAGNNYNASMNKYNENWSYEITGQNDIGVVSYFIWCNDTSGNDNQTAVYQVQINDVTKPEIEHTPVTLANVSETINITAKITDDVEVDVVYLNYTGVNGINQNISMTKWNGNWSFDVPSQVSTGEIEYFIWANDTSGNANQTDTYQISVNDVIIPDTTPPTIISKSPTGINVSITTTITIAFGESMNTTSVQDAIVLSPGITVLSHNWNADNTTITIVPLGNLSYNTTYNVTVGIGAKDVAGNNLESVTSWEFKTGSEPVINNPDGGIGEYWWIIAILIVAIVASAYLFQRFREEKEPEEETDTKEDSVQQ